MVLAQPASASICERINSKFEFVKDRRRNRLSHTKANLLVGLLHNLRLLKRMMRPEYTEPAIAWSDDLEKSAVGRYQPGSQPGSSSGPSLLLQGPRPAEAKLRTPGSYLPALNEDV